ncbi:hypothetical protein E3P91_01034 [Wallemia ichthyophaga]|nr:hypothetical protein E3P91_01034 [Wallemia ichthyophaga]
MKIKIGVSNKRAYIWNVWDIARLRVEYHISGILVGTLPGIQQQNVFLGPPLLLLPEEAWVLVEQGVAQFVDLNDARLPTNDEINHYHQHKLHQIELEAQETKARNSKEPVLSDKDVQRRQQKREERAAAKSKAGFMFETDSTFTQSSPIPVDEKKSRLPNTFTITVPATSEYTFDNDNLIYSDLDSARSANVWTYPETPLELNKCRVFKDLWQRGMFMGDGIRFGGHLLVYPGDPLRYHSHFTVTVLESMSSSIKPIDIVALGRLGTTVKKVHLLASYNDKTDKVDYISLEWAGFGT